MRFGIWTPLPHTVREEPRMTQAISEAFRRGDGSVNAAFEFALDTALKAEGYGFAITLIAERFMGPDLESWMLSAALAAKTQHIEIMPAIHPGMISPHIVAKMGTTLDLLSNGRFAINVVNGWWKEEFNLFGNGAWLDKPEDRHRRMHEFVQVLRGLWTEESFSFDGEFYRFDQASLFPRPKRVPAPPIYAASRSEDGKEVIARHCDLWFANYGSDPTQWQANIRGLSAEIEDINARAAGFGRRLDIGISALAVCADTMEEAQVRAEELLAYGTRGRIEFIATNGLGLGLIGTPKIIAERLAELESIGVDLVMLKFSPMLEQLDRFGGEVMPLLEKKRAWRRSA